MKEHILKTIAIAWDAVASGEKTFEVRRNDRFFQRGDIVVLRKLADDNRTYAPGLSGGWSTCDLRFKIGWMPQGGQFGIEPGYCAFSLEAAPRENQMTRTPHDAIAQAIAALEPFAALADAYPDVGRFKHQGDYTKARDALASLRSLANAPADAGRNAVIEECAKVIDEFRLEFVTRKNGKDGRYSQLNCQLIAKFLGQACARIRAIAAAPAETVGRGED